MSRRFRFSTVPAPAPAPDVQPPVETPADLASTPGWWALPTFMGVGVSMSEYEIVVISPYHPSFPPAARRLGGRWAKPVWVFDKRDEPEVRAALFDVYGTDGTPIPREALWTVIVRLYPYVNYGRQLWGVGREIVSRREYKWAVRYGRQVRLLAGLFASEGGTRVDPQLMPLAPYVELRIRDVPPYFCEDRLTADVAATFTTSVDVMELRAGDGALVMRA